MKNYYKLTGVVAPGSGARPAAPRHDRPEILELRHSARGLVTVFRLRKTEGGPLSVVAHRNLAGARETGRDRFLDTLGGLWDVHLEYRVRSTLSFSRKTIFFENFVFFHGFP